jgi:hypothetical protein
MKWRSSNMKASRFQNSLRFTGFVAKKETNYNRGRVMEWLVFW